MPFPVVGAESVPRPLRPIHRELSVGQAVTGRLVQAAFSAPATMPPIRSGWVLGPWAMTLPEVAQRHPPSSSSMRPGSGNAHLDEPERGDHNRRPCHATRTKSSEPVIRFPTAVGERQLRVDTPGRFAARSPISTMQPVDWSFALTWIRGVPVTPGRRASRGVRSLPLAL